MKLSDYFLQLEWIAEISSHDSETKVAAVAISRDTRLQTNPATNQFIDVSLKFKLPNTRPQKYLHMEHAETRLIYDSAKNGISLKNSIVICTHSPCANCAKALFQSGIDTIYFKTVRKDLDNFNYLLDLKGKLVRLKSGYYKLKLSIRNKNDK